MTPGRLSDMLIKHNLERRFRGQIGQRNKTSILLRVSTVTQPRPQGQGQVASAAVRWGATPAILLRADERNKIKILLRLNRVYVIITTKI